MKRKTAYLVINPKAGENLAKLTGLLAVFSAAGWKTQTAIREYGSHAAALAQKGADAKHDLVIAYGGDGTLNQVVNGVMRAKTHESIVGLIPGGTANVWAGEIGVPTDPLKAALSLVSSEALRVDLGHVGVERLAFAEPSNVTETSDLTSKATKPKLLSKRAKTRSVKPRPGARSHFLLMAGLGIDATIMRRVSKSLKEKIGAAAVALAAIEEMPSHEPFPIEIRSSRTAGGRGTFWKGEALQVVIGNTRRYGNIAELTPTARIDDGVLNVCVITAGSPLSTMQQILSVLLQRQAHNASTKSIRAAHFDITVPASIDLQLDGSVIKLKDQLSKSDWRALSEEAQRSNVMVTYRFDALPAALRVAIPVTYSDALFKESADRAKNQTQAEPEAMGEQLQQEAPPSDSGGTSLQPELTKEEVAALMNEGRKITVAGRAADPAKRGTYIVAGIASNARRGDSKPVALVLDKKTKLLNRDGESLPLTYVAGLKDGEQLVVEGKPSKRGVIRAKRIVAV